MKSITKRMMCLLAVTVMLLTLAVSGMQVKAAMAEVSSEDTIDPERILYTFTADDFRLPYMDVNNGDCFMEDADSSVGKAAVLSYATRAQFGDNGMINAMIRSGNQTLSIYSQGSPEVLVGGITVQQLKDNAAQGGYTLYRFQNVELMPGSGEYFIYIFDCWGFQVRFNEEQMTTLRDKKVDFYLSLKVTGDVSDNETNTPTYYIDKIILAEKDPNGVHEHSFGTWGFDDESHRRVCSECGEMEKGVHEWDEGTVVQEATATEDGRKVYKCMCGQTKSVVLSSLNGSAATQPEPTPDNTGIIIAVVMAAVAAVIVVVAVILLKPKKK